MATPFDVRVVQTAPAVKPPVKVASKTKVAVAVMGKNDTAPMTVDSSPVQALPDGVAPIWVIAGQRVFRWLWRG